MDSTHSMNTRLILSAHRALYRAIPKNTKAIYAKIIGETLVWKVYYDGPLSEEELEALDSAQTEIIADFPEIMTIDQEIIEHPQPIDFTNTFYWEWMYTRYQG